VDTYISSGGVSVAALATLPAASDDLIRQHSRLPEDDTPLAPEHNRTIPEHEPSSKGKKKKGKKNKVAKAATETPPDDMYETAVLADERSSDAAGSIQIDDASVRGDREATE
jgi:hypothetical protein